MPGEAVRLPAGSRPVPAAVPRPEARGMMVSGGGIVKRGFSGGAGERGEPPPVGGAEFFEYGAESRS